MTLGRVYIDEITQWGRAGILLLVGIFPLALLAPLLPVPTATLVGGGLVGFGLVFLLMGIDRAAIATAGDDNVGHASSSPGHADSSRDSRTTITISTVALAGGLSIGGAGLIALGAVVALPF